MPLTSNSNDVAGTARTHGGVAPQPSSISLPAVVIGADYQLEVARTNPVDVVVFSCRGRPLTVTLLVRADDNPEDG